MFYVDTYWAVGATGINNTQVIVLVPDVMEILFTKHR